MDEMSKVWIFLTQEESVKNNVHFLKGENLTGKPVVIQTCSLWSRGTLALFSYSQRPPWSLFTWVHRKKGWKLLSALFSETAWIISVRHWSLLTTDQGMWSIILFCVIKNTLTMRFIYTTCTTCTNVQYAAGHTQRQTWYTIIESCWWITFLCYIVVWSSLLLSPDRRPNFDPWGTEMLSSM